MASAEQIAALRQRAAAAAAVHRLLKTCSLAAFLARPRRRVLAEKGCAWLLFHAWRAGNVDFVVAALAFLDCLHSRGNPRATP